MSRISRRAINRSGKTVPAYGLVVLDGIEVDSDTGRIAHQIGEPNMTDKLIYVNGPGALPDDEYGEVFTIDSSWVLADSGISVSAGSEFGVGDNADFTAGSNGTGLFALGAKQTLNGKTLVLATAAAAGQAVTFQTIGDCDDCLTLVTTTSACPQFPTAGLSWSLPWGAIITHKGGCIWSNKPDGAQLSLTSSYWYTTELDAGKVPATLTVVEFDGKPSTGGDPTGKTAVWEYHNDTRAMDGQCVNRFVRPIRTLDFNDCNI